MLCHVIFDKNSELLFENETILLNNTSALDYSMQYVVCITVVQVSSINQSQFSHSIYWTCKKKFSFIMTSAYFLGKLHIYSPYLKNVRNGFVVLIWWVNSSSIILKQLPLLINMNWLISMDGIPMYSKLWHCIGIAQSHENDFLNH